MSAEALVGIVVIAIALGTNATLVWRSRKTIERIARRKLKTARDLLRDPENG